jgi:hypothetical protein
VFDPHKQLYQWPIIVTRIIPVEVQRLTDDLKDDIRLDPIHELLISSLEYVVQIQSCYVDAVVTEHVPQVEWLLDVFQ